MPSIGNSARFDNRRVNVLRLADASKALDVTNEQTLEKAAKKDIEIISMEATCS